MTKAEYKKARRLIRDNGSYALRLLSEDQRNVMASLQGGKDKLAEREAIVEWCKKEGYDYSFYNLM
jgi:hypothetical protein